jgi:radical SAM superfamily enzyme YgiQ (UPF0313 family)
MRVLFIDPMGDKASTGLNIGIAYCAASILKHNHTVGVLDLVNIREGLPSVRIKRAVGEFYPDIIGLSITNMSFNNSKSYIEGLRSYFKGTVVLGGPEITALSVRSLELIPGADIAVIGEGEITFVELLDAIANQVPLESVNGLVWRNDQGIIVNPPREFISDLDEVTFPNYDIFGVDKMDVYPILTSRGCPHGCIFCFSHLGKKWRARKPGNIIEELRIAKKRFGIKLFQVSDASFNMDIGRVEEFCQLLIKEKLDLPWVIQGFRADRMTENMMQHLSMANCRRIGVGIETLDEEVFKNVRKGESIDEIEAGIGLMKKYNIEIFGYMLMGLPGDTLKKTLRSFEKAREFNLNFLTCSSCVPFTGTSIEKWARDNAITLADSYSVSSIGIEYNDIAFETEDFTREERIKAWKILSVRNGSYNETDADARLFKFKKWLLILRYDTKNIFKRIMQSIVYRRGYKNSVDRINLKRGIYFSRLPDGTWGIQGDAENNFFSTKRLFLDLKRLTMTEV